jgi:esterase/lipase superfamily enzyme
MVYWASRLALLIMLLVLPMQSHAQRADATGWTSLGRYTIAPGSVSWRMNVKRDFGRFNASRLIVVSGALDLERVIIHYSNGQQHYEDRPIKLAIGQRLSPIDDREEERRIDAIEVVMAKGSAPKSEVVVEIGGIKRPAVGLSLPAARPPVPVANPPTSTPRTASPASETKPYAAVPVFFGTDRKREADRSKWGRNLAAFSGIGESKATWGRAVISVPTAGREKGEIRRPEWDLIFTTVALRAEDLARDFVLLNVDVLDRQSLVSEIKKHARAAKTFKDQAFVFVHGYRVGFDDALFRTAQIAHDMGFDGVPFVYSWPSSAGVAGYLYDERRAKGARDHLREFLDMVAKESGAKKVHLIAHSMGAQALLEALRDMRNQAGSEATVKPIFSEVIMAAPDVTRDEFESIAQKVRGLSTGMTLYASSNDKALRLSQRLSGASAGHVPANGPVVVGGVDSIDVSAASTDFFSLNHSAFASRSQLLDDMRLIFDKGQRPPDQRVRAYTPVKAGSGTYWRFDKKD